MYRLPTQSKFESNILMSSLINNGYFEYLSKEEQDEILKELNDVYDMVANHRFYTPCYTCDFCKTWGHDYVDKTYGDRNICLDCSGRDPKEVLSEIFKKAYKEQMCPTKDIEPPASRKIDYTKLPPVDISNIDEGTLY